MKITKTDIKKQIKGLWNNTMIVNLPTGKIRVALVGWHQNEYKIVPLNKRFDGISDREYKPIKDFYYKQELVDHLYKLGNA